MSLPKLSPRKCKVCGLNVPARIFGQHIFSHSDTVLASWPGGASDILLTLKLSLQQSIQESEGYPSIQAQMRTSLEYINSLLPHSN